MHRLAASLLLLLALGIAAPATAAEGREDGFVTAYAYGALPGGAPMRLDPRDDAAEVVALLPGLRETLQRRGHTIDAAAPLAMVFGLALDDDLSLSGSGGGDAGTQGEARVVHLGSDSRLKRDPRDLNRYRLSLSVEDRRSGRRVWSAEAVFAADYRGALPIARAVAAVMLDSLGQSVSRLSLTFD